MDGSGPLEGPDQAQGSGELCGGRTSTSWRTRSTVRSQAAIPINAIRRHFAGNAVWAAVRNASMAFPPSPG